MSSIDNKNIEDYINNVCGLIKNKKVHESVSDELLSHIDEIVEFHMNEGKSEEESVNKALIQMGSYDAVGSSLNKVHKAEPDWVLLIMTSIFVIFSIFIIGFMNKNNALGEYGSNTYLINTIIYTTIGIAISYCILKVDYRNFKKYSKGIYIGAIIISLVGLFMSSAINGVGGWIIIGEVGLNIFHITPILFIISLAGIFENYSWNSIRKVLIGFILAFGPCIFFILATFMPSTIIYTIAITTLIIISGVKLRDIIIVGSAISSIFVVYIFAATYRLDRLLSYIKPEDSPLIYNQLSTLINSAGTLGKGGGLNLESLPSPSTSFIFTYITYSFGWITAIILVSLVLAFIIRIGFIGVNTKDIYGKLIVSSICSLFAAQFLLNILMNLNLVPIMPVDMPFISYSDTAIIINMLSIAIITSVHKWRNTPYVVKA